MKNKKYENIIWDWNGTLLNDIDICILSMNHLLVDRNLPTINKPKYKEVFVFPVQNYYEEIGFDFKIENFEIPALQFIEHYKNYIANAELFPEVKNILYYFRNKNFNQYILSAMEQKSLENSVHNLEISGYFTKICGIKNHFAQSKIARGVQLIQSENINTNKTLMVGDTLHDCEVANVLGIDCILVSQGHYVERRLQVNGNKVINNLTDLKKIL